MHIIDCIQGSEQWFAAKCGIPSASNFDKLLTTKGTHSKQSLKYLYRLAGEAITGIVEESYQNGAMLRGKEVEAEARQFYQLIKGVEVKEVGFVIDKGYGASPDGLVGEPGLVEIKCPIMSTHVSYLLANTLPLDYHQQIQGQLLVTGRKWCDFMSYYPEMNPLIIRVERDEKFLTLLQVELKVFLVQLKEVIKKIG